MKNFYEATPTFYTSYNEDEDINSELYIKTPLGEKPFDFGESLRKLVQTFPPCSKSQFQSS